MTLYPLDYYIPRISTFTFVGVFQYHPFTWYLESYTYDILSTRLLYSKDIQFVYKVKLHSHKL
jgi:hypothetical protein